MHESRGMHTVMALGLGAGTDRGRWLTGALCAAVLGLSPGLVAQTDPDELARRHFESGAAYFEEADYDNALKAFTKAYELSKRPEILLNLATVQERMQNLPAAVASLEEYLQQKPDADGADTIRRRIENLKRRIESEPPPPAPVEDAGAPAEQDAVAAPPAAPPPTATATATSSPPPPPPEDEGSDVPAYVLLSIGGLSAAGAVITGVLANSEHSDLKDTCSPNCTDDDVSSGKTMALTSTILTGVAVVGVGIGAALLFTGGSSSEAAQASPVPRVRVGLGPKGAGADATWRF